MKRIAARLQRFLGRPLLGSRVLLPPDPPKAAASEFTLAGLTLISPGEGRWEGRSVSVSDGIVSRIGSESNAEPSEFGAYRGAFLLPGLIDMHTHLPPANLLRLTPYMCLLYLLRGVTTIRETGDIDGAAVPTARNGIRAGKFPGPRIFACGPFIVGAKGRWSNSVRLGSPADADALVEKIRRDGFECVKAYDDLDVAQIRALQKAADERSMLLLGHVPTKLSYEEALLPDTQHLMGIAPPASLSRDHIFDRMADWHAVDDARLRRIVQVTVEHHLANTPTLVAGEQLELMGDYDRALRDPDIQLMPRFMREVVWNPTRGLPFYRNLSAESLARLHDGGLKKKRLVRMLHDSGAPLYLGTDTSQPFVVPGASLQQEMRIFAEIGIPASEVWEMATKRAGQALNKPMLGTIREGAPADLLVFRCDPTVDLDALNSLEAVIVQGRLYRLCDLQRSVEQWNQHFEGSVFDRLSVMAAPILMKFAVRRNY